MEKNITNKKTNSKIVFKPLREYIQTHYITIIILTFFVFSAAFLMFSTFGYQDGSLVVKTKLNSDFLSHIPLIRSFSMGENYPVEYPHFSGVPIKYHFLFYAMSGLLEKCGIRIDVALNILSTIGFAGLMIAVYFLAKKLTKSAFVGLGASLVIMFNTSLSWIYYFFIGNNHLSNFTDLLKTSAFGSFGPYDDNIISAFWNLNIYTNQRHLAFSFLIMFIVIWFVIYSKSIKKLVLAILLIGVLSFMHKAVLMILFITLGVFFFAFKKKIKRILISIFIGFIFALPGLILLSVNTTGYNSNNPNNSFFTWQPGFLYKSTSWWEMIPGSDLEQFIIYWFLNMGLLPILALSGFIITAVKSKEESYETKSLILKVLNVIRLIYKKCVNPKTAWFLAGTLVFIIANLFNFGLDIANNHKLINFAIFTWGIYAFIFLKEIWTKFHIFGKIYVPIVMILLLFGGFCDLFPIINDDSYLIDDISKSKNAQWIVQNSNPKDNFLNLSSDFYFVLIGGRRVYLGVPYFNWSLGYPIDQRTNEIIAMQSTHFPKTEFCALLKMNNLKFFYVNVSENKINDKPFDVERFVQDYPEGTDLDYGIRIYKTENVCK